MQTFQTTISLTNKPVLSKELFTEDSVFFDIETTGFSPKKTSLYMIGYAIRSGENANITQLLADGPFEEVSLLRAFLDTVTSCRKMISFNGSGFDIPYLSEKLAACNLPNPFGDLEELDIFKRIRPYKALLSLPSCKQKAVEDFLSLKRKDTYSGGDLIPVYRHYAATHDSLPLSLLLRHNLEDVCGMIDLLPVLSYPKLFEGGFSISSALSENDTFVLRMIPEFPFPVPVSKASCSLHLTLEGSSAILRIPVFSGELKYFFPNPKDYYYLPEEDMAIHKSVGSFVEKSHRIAATKDTCYIKKTGRFLPQCSDIFQPVFRTHYKDKQSFFELPEDISLDSTSLREYLKSCLDGFIKTSTS